MGKYDGWKDVYRDYPAGDMPWELGRPRDVLIELVDRELVGVNRVLDLCCGAGSNTVYLAEKGFSVVAMDISPDAVAFAQDKADKAGVKVSFTVGNFLDLPFRDGSFDLVFDFGCFHHVLPEDRKSFVRGIRRVLKDGGLYQLTCFSNKNGPSWNHFTEDDIRKIFSGDFAITDIKHYGSLENDGVVRYFYTFLMEKI